MTLKSGTNLFLSRRAARCFFFREGLRQLVAKRQEWSYPPRRPPYEKDSRLARVNFISVYPEVELDGISAPLGEDEGLRLVAGDFHLPAARPSC